MPIATRLKWYLDTHDVPYEIVHHERGGQRTGTETVWRAQRKPAFHDSFFTPPDRRQLRADFTQRVFRPMDLVAATIRPIPLPKGTSWQDARAERERVAEEVAEGLADTVHRLDPRADFSIDWKRNQTEVTEATIGQFIGQFSQ